MRAAGVARLEPRLPDDDGRVFRDFAVGSGPRSMRVNVLHETRDGTLMAGTDGGLFRGLASPSLCPRRLLRGKRVRLPRIPDASCCS